MVEPLLIFGTVLSIGAVKGTDSTVEEASVEVI